VLATLLAGAGGFRSQDQAPAPEASSPATTAPAPQTAPADAGAGAVSNSVVVTSLEGKARARRDPDAAWQIVEVGMRLPQGAEIQTGPTGRVVCSVPPGREFVVDRMSKVTVLEAEQTGNRVKTDLLMEYGRTDLRVQKAGLEQDARIRTPGATASVRGTQLSVYNQPPFAPELKTYTGVVDFRVARRQLTVAKGGRSSGGRGSAETALLASVVDPSTPNARTNSDAALISHEVSRGAVVNYNPDIQLAEIRGGAGAQTDAQLTRSLPGRLNFVIRWQGNADIDIFVANDSRSIDQIFGSGFSTFNPDSTLYPGFGLQTSPSGGQIPYNHRGGANGGQEICFWQSKFPTGVFGFSALNNSTTTAADVRFNAFLDGQKIPMYGFDADFNLIRTNGIRQTIAPVSTDPTADASSVSTIVPVPRSDFFEEIIPESPDQTLDQPKGQVGAAKSQQQQSPGKQSGKQAAAPASSGQSQRGSARAAVGGQSKGREARTLQPRQPAVRNH
jgi:hypothetical protein